MTDVIQSLNSSFGQSNQLKALGVPLKLNRATPENLIIPINPEYSINEDKLDRLLIYLRPSLKNIDFISIDRSVDKKNLSTNYLMELTNKYNGSITTSYKIFKSKNVFEEFKSYAVQKENSFLVLQKGGHTFKDSVLKRFLINKIVHDGSIPLIVLPS